MTPVTRRELLTRAGQAAIAGAGLSAVDAAGKGKTPQNAPDRKLKVVVAGGHPGDPEYGCGGTIARYTGLGHDLVLLYLNDGAWPVSKGGAPASVRLAEAKKACQILKARPLYAGQINGNDVVDAAHFDHYRKVLEDEQPDVVITQWPIDHHRDHRAISALTFDAWLQMDKRFALYYYEVSDGEDTLQFAPTHYVDITAVEAVKREACYAHASQTPDKYYALQDQVARFRGIESGVERAEGFILQVRSPYQPLPAST